MSKRVRVLAWFMVFAMLFTCACTVARVRKTDKRNEGGDHKPECEASVTYSTPPTLPDDTDYTDYTDLTAPTFPDTIYYPLEDIIEICKNCIGMHIEDAEAYLWLNLDYKAYGSWDTYDDSLPYEHGRTFSGIEPVIVIEGVTIKSISMWADDKNFVQDIEFNIREDDMTYSQEDYDKTASSEKYLPASGYAGILSPKLELIYGESVENDASWLEADPYGWESWDDGGFDVFLFWGENVSHIDGNNMLTFGIFVPGGGASSSDVTLPDGDYPDDFSEFAGDLVGAIGQSKDDVVKIIENDLGIELDDVEPDDDNGSGFLAYSYKISADKGSLGFTQLVITTDADTGKVLDISFYSTQDTTSEAEEDFQTCVDSLDKAFGKGNRSSDYPGSNYGVGGSNYIYETCKYRFKGNTILAITRTGYTDAPSDNSIWLECYNYN